MTTDNFSFYLQNRLIQTSKTGGQRYSDTSRLVFPARVFVIARTFKESKNFGLGIQKGEVALYHWPPVCLVWNQLYDN
jgi:hypothetical protein